MDDRQTFTIQAIQQLQKMPFKKLVLFEDEDYVVVNKPAFVSTLDDRHFDLNIMALAKEYTEDAQVCHRLDKETSGVLVIAKNPEAYRSLSIQFEKRKVNKTYHAVCDGIHNFQQMKIADPLYVSSKGVVKVDRQRGKEAVTIVNTLKAYRRHTLVSCEPVTGRMHQIRVHLASQGASISGDEQYGGKPFYLSAIKRNYNLKKDTEELPLIKRVALHARAIGFELLNGQPVRVEAPYPKDFAVVLKQLEKNA
jgi:23S rRNA pseudouridine955/2504/2580 synthase